MSLRGLVDLAENVRLFIVFFVCCLIKMQNALKVLLFTILGIKKHFLLASLSLSLNVVIVTLHTLKWYKIYFFFLAAYNDMT